MAAAKFITKEGNILFPCYMSDKDKQELKEKTNKDTTYMWCGCSEENKLYYKVASDLKIVPVHHGYQHSANCPRVIDRRNSGYLQGDDGKSIVYLKFKPGTYSPSKKKEEATELEEEKETTLIKDSKPASESVEEKKDKYEKDKNLGIREFIKQLNYDAFMYRQGEGKSILPSDYFINVLLSRLKTVEISGTKKPLRYLSLEEDSCMFFYAPMVFIGKTEFSRSEMLRIRQQWYNGQETITKERNLFIFDTNVEKAKLEYEELYGMDVNEAVKQGKKVMAAGFIVRKKSKGTYNKFTRTSYSKTYDVVGQFSLFNVNKNGLYCGSDIEEVILDTVLEKPQKYVKYILPSEHESFVVNIIKGNKQGYIFKGNKPAGYKERENVKIFSCHGEIPDKDELLAWKGSI